MLKIRPSPGSQSTLTTPLPIFQSVALLVSMVICPCAAGDVCNRTSAIAERRRRCIGEAPACRNSGDLAAVFELQRAMVGFEILVCQYVNNFRSLNWDCF